MAEKQFTTFYLDEDYLGIDIKVVREIYRNPEITPVALAADYVCGLLNLRGQVITVIDLGVKLGRDPRLINKKSSCIVLKANALTRKSDNASDKTAADHVAILVDKIGDVISVDESLWTSPPAHSGSVDGRFISGVITRENSLLVTLDVHELLALDNN